MPVGLEHAAVVTVPVPGHGGTTVADLDECASDLEKLYGPHPDRAWLDDGERVSYADLVAGVADDLKAYGIGPIDLVMTVYPVLDCQARILPGCLLAELLGSRPLVLGVNDQGAAGPFTGLRLVANHLASGERRRACVILMEQSTLPPEPGHPLPARTGAVLLVLGTASGRPLTELTVRRTDRSERTGTGTASRLQTGYLEPWYDLAVRQAERPDDEIVVAHRDKALGYDCHVRFGPAVPSSPSVAHLDRRTLEARP